MLFPPPGVKIRRTIETQWLTDQPTIIAEHDTRRALLLVLVDDTNGMSVAFAGTEVGLDTVVAVGNGYSVEFHFVGPEEVWAKCIDASTLSGVAILVQSVFYD